MRAGHLSAYCITCPQLCRNSTKEHREHSSFIMTGKTGRTCGLLESGAADAINSEKLLL